VRAEARYPSLFQLNTRVRLTALSREINRRATLDDLPDAELDGLAERGVDWVWLLSVWQTGLVGRGVSRSHPEWREEFKRTLPDLTEEDIAGSGFAITGYTVHRDLGGDEALARLRDRLSARGLRLMLDFVANHTGLDHPWVQDHPDYYVRGTEADLARAPADYLKVRSGQGETILAHGRDPYFPGWPDTLQLNYGNPAVQEAMTGTLAKIAGQSDGVRCDMAMLVLPDVFERTWGISMPPFWPSAVQHTRDRHAGFCFMAEVYWDLEWTLQQQGFDYTYDKRLYDRLREGHVGPVREHFRAGSDYQDKLARFLENHDEPRAAATFPRHVHRAAAVITYLAPGLRFFHEGQFEGRTVRISPHLVRGPVEPIDRDLQSFYTRLLAVVRQPVVRGGRWQLLELVPAWDGNWTWDAIVAFAWEALDGTRLIVAVNFSDHQSQCYLRLPFADLAGSWWRLDNQLGSGLYERDGTELQTKGLYLDMAPWETFVYSLKR
jgi:glycosidase